MRQSLAVMLGGVLGTLARAGVAELLAPPVGTWPWATFAVNVVGAAFLGWLSVATPDQSVSRALLGTGFCGALTTFSTFQLETLRLVDGGAVGLAAAYAVVSVAAGLGAAWLGRRVAVA